MWPLASLTGPKLLWQTIRKYPQPLPIIGPQQFVAMHFLICFLGKLLGKGIKDDDGATTRATGHAETRQPSLHWQDRMARKRGKRATNERPAGRRQNDRARHRDRWHFPLA